MIDDGDIEGVKKLIEDGADANERDAWGDSALSCAADAREIEILKILVVAGADINELDKGITALGWAAYYNRIEVARALIGEGADVNIKDSDGVTALWHARTLDHKEIEEMLLDAGAIE